jgi:hypothetical protein
MGNFGGLKIELHETEERLLRKAKIEPGPKN